MCDHKRKKTLVTGEYESDASTGYMVSPALYWCPSCGAYAWEEPGQAELRWKNPRGKP